MDIFSSVIHFLTDKSRKLSSKAIAVMIVIVLIIFLDNTFSFSYYYNNSQKISQTKELNEVLKDSSLTKLELEKLTDLRKNIVNHRTFKDVTYDYLLNLNFDNTSEDKSIGNKQSDNELIRNEHIHLLTSAWWLIIPMIFLIIVFPYVIITERKQLFSTALGFIIILCVFYLLSLILSKILSFIPLILGNPIYNYSLNVVLSGLIPLGIYFISKRNENRKKIENSLKNRIYGNNIFDLLKFEYENLPDSTFEKGEDYLNESGVKITDYTKDFKNKIFHLFDKLEIKTFENSKGKNFIFSNENFKTDDIGYLRILVNKLAKIYGKDSIGSGLFNIDDEEQLQGDFWLGRSWTSEEHKIPIMISYDKDTGLDLTIWLTPIF